MLQWKHPDNLERDAEEPIVLGPYLMRSGSLYYHVSFVQSYLRDRSDVWLQIPTFCSYHLHALAQWKRNVISPVLKSQINVQLSKQNSNQQY